MRVVVEYLIKHLLRKPSSVMFTDDLCCVLHSEIPGAFFDKAGLFAPENDLLLNIDNDTVDLCITDGLTSSLLSKKSAYCIFLGERTQQVASAHQKGAMKAFVKDCLKRVDAKTIFSRGSLMDTFLDVRGMPAAIRGQFIKRWDVCADEYLELKALSELFPYETILQFIEHAMQQVQNAKEWRALLDRLHIGKY